jgi:folate-binding protein YgfZ
MPEVGFELYKLIRVSGDDAVDFLQGQLTQDVTELAAAGRQLAAWCNPKGRVIAVIRLVDMDHATGLLVPDSLAEKLVSRLQMYRLRAKVDIEASDEPVDNWLEPAERDPASMIEAGVAWIDAGNTEEFTPHMLNLDKLGAISFTKGCYTGQEIVARTEHLGKSKRRMMRYRAAGTGIAAGASVSDGDRTVGQVVNVDGTDLLAVTPVDLHEQPLAVDGVAITPQGLPYDV